MRAGCRNTMWRLFPAVPLAFSLKWTASGHGKASRSTPRRKNRKSRTTLNGMNRFFVLLALLGGFAPFGRTAATKSNMATEAARQPVNGLPVPRGVKTRANPFAAAGQERPNFLFLFSDDQTFRALGLLG